MKLTLAISLLISSSGATMLQRSAGFEPTETYTETHRQKNLNEPPAAASHGMVYAPFCRDGNFRAVECKAVCRDAAGVQHECLETAPEYQHITR